MKSAIFAAAALVGSVAVAQPHAHQHRHEHQKAKRAVVIEYTTVYETATVWVDEYSTVTVQPSKAAEAKPTVESAGGQFYQAPSSSVVPPPVVVPSSSPAAVYTPPAVSSPPAAETPVAYTPPAAPTPSASSGTGTGTGTGTSTGGGASSGGYDHQGKITYYAVGLGSCGYNDEGADQTKNIVAVSLPYFRSVSDKTSYGLNQPANPLCDKTNT